MKLVTIFFFLSLLSTLSTGCVSRAGPFVTNISAAGPGTLNVEKCMVEWSYLSESMQMGECTTHVVSITQGDPAYRPDYAD